MRPSSVTALLAGVGLLAFAGCLAAAGASRDPGVAVDAAIAVAVGAPAGIVAGVLLRHRPGHPFAPVLVAVAVTPVVVGAGDVAWVWADAAPPWAARILADADEAMWPLWYLCLALLLMLFPTGRPAGPRWGRAVATVVLLVVALVVDGFAVLGLGESGSVAARTAGVAGIVLGLLLLPVLVLALAAPVARYRRSGAQERRQLRWLGLVGLTVPGTLLFCWIGYLMFDGPEFAVIGLAVMYLAIPGGVAVALLDDELWDVDRVLAATLAHLALSGAVLALFTGLALAAGALAPQGSVVPAVLATALCAAVFLPLRVRLQRVVDRFVHPARAVALQGVEALRGRTGEDSAPPEQLVDVLREVLHDPGLLVGFRVPGSRELVDARGEPVDVPDQAGESVPVVLAGAEIGVLVPGSRRSRHLMREVAAASAPVVEVVRLRLQVRRALAEAEGSRSRLLQVSYEERRRLERDLHDGAQQRLVSLGMALRLAQRRLSPAVTQPAVGQPTARNGSGATVDVDDVLDRAVAEIATAVAELRQVAHGIRPSCLDDGLPAALASIAETVPVDVQLSVDLGDVPGRLPPDIETTAFFVANEAVANAVKHAGAARIDLRLSRAAEGVVLVVADDGRGGAACDGQGLAGLDDRVRAHGGRLQVLSPHGGGTRVEALLPCAS